MLRQRFINRRFWSSNIFTRSYKTKEVRVRFAPSPTGHLHLGGLRTALYNYLFALSKKGKMILRIEDTDQTRIVPGAMDGLIENLNWAGIYCHEGPTQGGQKGPYVQSKRLDIYQSQVQTLLANGSAYRCFCSDKRLDLLRRDALRNRQVPKYDNRCRHLSAADVEKKVDNEDPNCIRFKLTSDCKYFDDLVYGSIAYDISEMEGDPVIMKTDGYPTYHFANVVDDHLMEISHVLRGVEWQISTTKHILMYRAFGWEPPAYAHLPLIMNADGTKLSKRQDDIRVEEYRKRGILPAALVNYVTLAGGGFSRVPGEGMRATTMDELASMFQLNLVNPNSSRLNPDLLTECNRLEIIEQLKDDSRPDSLVDEVERMIKHTFKNQNVKCDPEHIKSVLKWSSGRMTSLKDLVSDNLAFIWVLPEHLQFLDSSSIQLLERFISRLRDDEAIKYNRNDLKNLLKEFSSQHDVEFKELMHLLRRVLSGIEKGPSVAEMIEILGKEGTIQRITKGIKREPYFI